MSADYWEASLPELLERFGVVVPACVDLATLAKAVDDCAGAETSYRAPVSAARIGLSDYERGFQAGREQAMREVGAALGDSLELVPGRDGLRLQMDADTALRGHTSVSVGEI